MDLTVTMKPAVEKYVIEVAGEIDISNADKMRDAINMALEQPCDAVALDFSQVAYIDSTGIGVLVGASHHAEHAQPNVLRVVQLLGVDEEIHISGN